MLRAFMVLAVTVCCAFSAVGQTRYELRAGEAIPMAAPQETLDFLLHAKSRNIEIAGGGLVAGPNRAGDRIMLGASLRMKPGEYTVKLSATSAAGEERQTAHDRGGEAADNRAIRLDAASGGPFEWMGDRLHQALARVASSSSETFGNLADYLVADGVPVVYLFDNCLEDPNQTIETLGNDLAAFLNSIKYDNGAQVPQIDLVGFSLGGLIARAYLAGLQPRRRRSLRQPRLWFETWS